MATVDKPEVETGRIPDSAIEHWRENRLASDYERVPPRRGRFETLSGIPIADVYTARDVADLDELRDLGLPGEYPFTRGVHASMFRGRPWTIRQVAGFGQAEDTNRRYRYLLDQGETGLSTDFDLPTLLGHDSDHPVFNREVGKIGVAIDTVEDMHALFEEIPLERISASLTVTGSAAILLAMYRVMADERGVPGTALTGTLQNDILKEYTAQNEFIYPPDPSVELVVDTMEYSAQVMPRFNPVSVSGYHIREAGSNAVEEVALTIGAGLTYLERAAQRGLDPDLFAPRLSFFFDVHNDFFEEIAKFRAARRLWARLTRERIKCRDPRSWMMRAHAQTAGVSLTAQQPLNNVVRTAVQALAGVLGGVQSMHTNSLDEAYAIPSEEAIKIAVRTQQMLLHESGAADVVDPLAGSYYVETLTTELEHRAEDLLDRIDELGGMVAGVQSGFLTQLIGNSSWDQQQKLEANDRVMVGVNEFVDDDSSTGGVPLFRLDPGSRERQLARLSDVKRSREGRRAAKALREIEAQAPDLTNNMMPAIEEAVRARCTVGEISNVLRHGVGRAPVLDHDLRWEPLPVITNVNGTGRPIRVVVAKPGLDGHDRGARVIARALRDAGMEVIYTGIFQSPESIVTTVLQEDAEVLGLSSLSGAHMEYAEEIIHLLKDYELDDVLFVVGGTVPGEDAEQLIASGVAAVFGPGSKTGEVIEFIRSRTRGANA